MTHDFFSTTCIFYFLGVFCFCHHFFCILEFSVFNFFEYYGLKSWGDAKKSLNRTNKYFCLFTFIVAQFLQYYLRKDHVKTWLRQKQFPNSPSFLGVFRQRQGLYFFMRWKSSCKKPAYPTFVKIRGYLNFWCQLFQQGGERARIWCSSTCVTLM